MKMVAHQTIGENREVVTRAEFQNVEKIQAVCIVGKNRHAVDAAHHDMIDARGGQLTSFSRHWAAPPRIAVVHSIHRGHR